MHTVLRCGYRISTDSKVVPSTARHSVLRVWPSSQVMSRAARQQLRKQRLGNLTSNRGGQVGHLLRVGDEAAVVLMCELLGAKRRKVQRGDRLDAPGLVEVGQMTRRQRPARRLEYQLLLHE